MVKAGVCAKLSLAQLAEGKAEVKVFDGGQPEVDRQTIERAAAVAQTYAPDVVIGLGGGSNLDLSKAVALLVKYPGPLSAYYGENNVPGPIAPVVAVPTTAGTGSEVSPVAVVADPERAMKVGIASRAADSEVGHRRSRADGFLSSKRDGPFRHGCARARNRIVLRAGANRLLSARDLRRQESDVGRSRDKSDYRDRKIPSGGGSSAERPRCKARDGFGEPAWPGWHFHPPERPRCTRCNIPLERRRTRRTVWEMPSCCPR